MGIAQRAVANLGATRPAHISIRAQKFTLISEDSVQTPVPPTPAGFTLDVIIADANPATSRVCYIQAYDPKATDHPPPDCWSNDGKQPDESLGDGGGPFKRFVDEDGAYKVIRDPTLSCTTCWYNTWGSDVSKFSGKGVKKCQEGKTLAVVVAGGVGHGQAFQLRITPGTRKLFQAYCNDIGKKKVDGMALDLPHVITRLSFDPDVQGVLNFQPVGFTHDTDIDLAPMYEAHEFAPLLGGVETPLAELPAPLRPALEHKKHNPTAPQTSTHAGAAERSSPQKTDASSAAKYDLPFDDEIPFTR